MEDAQKRVVHWMQRRATDADVRPWLPTNDLQYELAFAVDPAAQCYCAMRPCCCTKIARIAATITAAEA